MSHDNYDREQHIGELLDRGLAEEHSLYYQPAWHPKYRARRNRRRNWRVALGGVAVLAAGVFVLPFTVQLPAGHGEVSNNNLASAHLPHSLAQQLKQASTVKNYAVASMTPVYGHYPIASPTGHNLTVNGHFNLATVSGNSLSLLLDNRMQIEGGMLFNNGTPVYCFQGSSLSSGSVISSSSAAIPAGGVWYQRGDSAISSVSDAGSHVYVTHGNTWADLIGYGKYYWISSPSSPPSTTVDSIAGLPSNPDRAVLTEESPSGASRGFITSNGGRVWRAWPLGSQSVTNLIAIGDRYWAILNGTLAWSNDGSTWHTALPLDVKRWQVETYAVDPSNANVISVALIPISGDGVGPILQTQNGGKNWSEIPNFPAIGASPSTMVMTSNGDIAALINLNGPVIVRYSAKSQQWTTFSVPAEKNNLGLGQMAASPNGNLLYASPGGLIYQWMKSSQTWYSIAPQPAMDAPGQGANLLEAIGNHQVLASYPSGWFVFDEISVPPTPTSNNSTPPNQNKAATH